MAAVKRGRAYSIERLRPVSDFAIDLVYPRRCAGCGRRGSWLCDDCKHDVVLFVQPWCQRCGVPIGFPCACHSLSEDIEQIRSVGPFAGWLRAAVINCKYHGEWARVDELATFMARACDTLPPFDLFVPVPLHSSRLRERGFNQSFLLARGAAGIMRKPVEDCLVRERRTDSQARLAAGERWLNVKGAIAVKPAEQVAGRAIVLVDDVVTTGATLAACATVLKEAGAVSVMATTVCREL